MDKFTRSFAYLDMGDVRYVYRRVGEEEIDENDATVIWPIVQPGMFSEVIFSR